MKRILILMLLLIPFAYSDNCIFTTDSCGSDYEQIAGAFQDVNSHLIWTQFDETSDFYFFRDLEIGDFSPKYKICCPSSIIDDKDTIMFSMANDLYQGHFISAGDDRNEETLFIGNSITIKEYINYLRNAYLFFELQKFPNSIKAQLNSPKKIYTIDVAFNIINGLNYSPNKRRILENIVFIELKRRKKERFYYNDTKECDFIIKEQNRIKEAIQVTYSLNENNKDREIQGLIEAMNKFKLKRGLIIILEQSDEIRIDNKSIKIMPVIK